MLVNLSPDFKGSDFGCPLKSSFSRVIGEYLFIMLDCIVADSVLLPQIAEAAQKTRSKARRLEKKKLGQCSILLKEVW